MPTDDVGAAQCDRPLMPRSHETFRSVLTVKLLGIMLGNRRWPTTFLTITAADADGWSWNCPVWSALNQTCNQVHHNWSAREWLLPMAKVMHSTLMGPGHQAWEVWVFSPDTTCQKNREKERGVHSRMGRKEKRRKSQRLFEFKECGSYSRG